MSSHATRAGKRARFAPGHGHSGAIHRAYRPSAIAKGTAVPGAGARGEADTDDLSDGWSATRCGQPRTPPRRTSCIAVNDPDLPMTRTNWSENRGSPPGRDLPGRVRIRGWESAIAGGDAARGSFVANAARPDDSGRAYELGPKQGHRCAARHCLAAEILDRTGCDPGIQQSGVGIARHVRFCAERADLARRCPRGGGSAGDGLRESRKRMRGDIKRQYRPEWPGS